MTTPSGNTATIDADVCVLQREHHLPVSVPYQDCYPACPFLPVVNYEQQLYMFSDRIYSLNGTQTRYRFDDLFIQEAVRMKPRAMANHEFVLLRVSLNDGVGRPFEFWLRLEKSMHYIAVCDLSSEASQDFITSLDGCVGERSWWDQIRDVFQRSNCIDAPAARYMERLISSSARSCECSSCIRPPPPTATMTALAPEDRSDCILERVTFNTECLPLMRGIAVASIVSQRSDLYSPFRHQSFFFADAILRCFEKDTRGNTQTFVPDQGTFEAHRNCKEWVNLGSKRNWNPWIGNKFKLVNIDGFRQSAFERVVWKAWEEYRETIDKQIARSRALYTPSGY